MTSRSLYLPRASILDKLPEDNRMAVLEVHQRMLSEEIAGIQSGYITVNHKGRAYYLRLARSRMNRLVKLAQSYGYWLDEKAA